MSRKDTETALPNGKTRRDDQFAEASNPLKDMAELSQGRALVAINPQVTPSKGRSRLTDVLFLAHMFATRCRAPQTCEKRRAEAGDANAIYRKAVAPPAAKAGRVLSTKI